MSGNGEVRIVETRSGGPKSGIVEGPTLREMRPYVGATDEFVYSFDFRYKGNPTNATSAAWESIPSMLEGLPEGLADGMVAGYRQLLGMVKEAESAKKQANNQAEGLRQERLLLQQATDDLEAKGRLLQQEIDKTKAERGRLASIKKDWKLRIDHLVAQRVESRRCDSVVEANRLRRSLAKVEGELKALKSALAVVGAALGRGE